ncbi:MAG: DUF177 domain-containing protein [Armatimonadota bacterium]
MRFDCLQELQRAQGTVTCDIEGPLPPGAELEAIGPVRGQIRLTNVGGGKIHARGTVEVDLRLECNRCLCPLQEAVRAEVGEGCALVQVDAPEAYVAEAEEEEALPIVDDDIIDLSELVRQNLVVNVPAVPLCSPNCRGLCSQCGQNLNEGDCGCRAERVDPRLAKLQELLPKPDDADRPA